MFTELLEDEVKASGEYVAEVIYGANDGIVTTFAVVSSVAGAGLQPSIVLILGIASLLADGFSMAMSNYLSRRSEIAYQTSTGNSNSETDEQQSPTSTAAVTFVAFIVAGWAPLFPYIFVLEPLFRVSLTVTGFAFFAVGASRSLVTDRRWYVNGGEMFLVGMLAAAVAYAVGNLLNGIA